MTDSNQQPGFSDSDTTEEWIDYISHALGCAHGITRRETARAVYDAIGERARQDDRWGDQSQHDDATWLAILTEEVGESAQAVLHWKFDGPARGTLRSELVQVAAVALAWIEAIDKRGERAGADYD